MFAGHDMSCPYDRKGETFTGGVRLASLKITLSLRHGVVNLAGIGAPIAENQAAARGRFCVAGRQRHH